MPKAQKNDIQRFRDFQQLANMLGEFGVSTVDAIAGLAAEFNLPARLQGNLRVAAGQRDDMPVLLLRLPSETLDQLPQNELDPTRAGIGNGFGRISVDADLFVLGSDAPAVARFSRVVEKGFQFCFFFND